MSLRICKSSRLSLAVSSVLLLPGMAVAQTVYTGANNGDWATAGNWSAGTPTGALNAQINNNASAVNVNLAANTTGGVNNLTIDAGDSLTLLNNSTLNIAGNLLANGTLKFSANPNESYLNFSSPTATIAGLIDFNYQTASPTAGVIQGPGSGTLTNNGTIRGLGTLRNIRFTNTAAGIIDANDNRGQLYIDPNNGGAGLFVNTGMMRATAGGLLTFTGDFGGDVVSTGGNIQANGAGSIVRFINSASVTGGNYSTTGGGEVVVEAGNTAFASPQSLSGTLRVRNNATLNLSGTMTNNGSIRLTSAGNLALLNVNAPLALSGTGSLVGEWSGTGSGPRIDTGSNLLTLGANQTVSGVVYFNNNRVTNNGLIDANSAVAATTGSGIIIDPNNGGAGLFINNGTMQSSAGGLLSITGDFGGDTINNGTISSTGTGSITELYNSASVSGGTWSNSAGGVIRVRPGQTGFLNGPITISPGSTFTVPANNINGQTTLNLNGTVSGNGGILRLDAAGAVSLLNLNGDTTLATGMLLHGAYTNVTGTSPGPRIDTGGNTLTINAGATVDGVVYFNNNRVINNGTIDANNVSGIVVDPSNQGPDLFVNNSIMQATGGGLMQIIGDNGGNVLNNGTIRAVGAGSIVELVNSISVSGGTISTSGGGVVRVKPGQTASLVGPATVSAGSTMTVLGTNTAGQTTLNVSGNYTLNGTLELNAAGATAVLNVAGDTTLGTGTLNGLYTNIGGSPGPRIDTGSNTLTVSAASTVQGVVNFNNARVINNGLIDCNNVAGMYVDANNQAAGLFVNNATMRSSAGGLMVLTGDNGGDFINNGTISSVGTGSITELYNTVTVSGGTWSNASGGVMRVRPGQTATLINPTIAAGSKFDVPGTSAQGQATLNANGTYTLNGVLDMTAQGAVSLLNVNGPLTIAGTGSLRGSYIGTGGGPRIDGGATPITVNAGATIEGVMYFNNVTVTNNGTILANNHAVPTGVGQFDIFIDANNLGAGKFINNGTIRATNGAAIGFTGDNGGNPTGNGPLIVDANSVIGTWNSVGGDMGPVSGAGTYRASNSSNLGHPSIRVGTIESINSANIRILPGLTPGLAAGTSKAGTVIINTSGKIDLANNGLVVTAMTQGNVRALIAPARNGGQWNGANGIGSSLANNNGKAIGYALASEIFTVPGTFLGQGFNLSDVLVRYTFNGDTDLNGTVNFDDLLKLAQNYDTVGTATWRIGDSTYDGNVNFDDLLAMAQQYSKTLFVNTDQLGQLGEVGGTAFTQDWALALAVVPEPASIGLLGAGMMMLRRRR